MNGWLPGKITYFAGMTSAPTVNDDQNDGYQISDVWIDETNDEAYVCVDNAVGAAVWEKVSSSAEYIAAIAAHAALTATHGASDIADVSDIAVDSNLSSAGQDAISKKHSQNTDTALGVVGTKDPPIDADKAIYRDSIASDALVTSTWTQIKAFLKTYFDTLYNNYVHPNHSGDVTSIADGATTIEANRVTNSMLAQVATSIVKGRVTAGTGNVEDLSASQLTGLVTASSESAAGKVELATTAEATAGTDTARAVTPEGLATKLGAQTDGGLLVGAGISSAVEALGVGLTTEILVGGGAGTNPVWTTVTGTGAPVRATSPTLVTPLLGTPTSGTLTNCTGLPQAGVVGLTTADSPVFATVKLSGLTDGYIPYHVADATGLADSGLFWDGTKLGIGTTGPVADLDIYGATNSHDGQIRLTEGNVSTTRIQIMSYATDNQSISFDSYLNDAETGWISSDAGSNFQIKKGSDRLNFNYDKDIAVDDVVTWNTGVVMDKDGNVGIGTVTPASLLEIQGGLTTTGPILTLGTKEPTVVANDVLGRINFYAPFEADGGDSRLIGASIVAIAAATFSNIINTTSLQFQTGNSETATTKMTILGGGNVGINETAPTISDGTGLHISGKILRLATAKTPASAGAAGNTGEICWDADFLYVCTATNSWERVAIATW